MWINLGIWIGKLLHYVSGFLVHPDKGGCCSGKISDIFDEFEDLTKHK